MTPTWQTADGSIRLYLGDCLDILPIGHFKGPSGTAGKYRNSQGTTKRNSKLVHGDDEPFDPVALLQFDNVLMFGANHYAQKLPPMLPLPEPEKVTDENDLKVLVNTFVWMHAPEQMTLGEADKMAVKIFELFMEARARAAV